MTAFGAIMALLPLGLGMGAQLRYCRYRWFFGRPAAVAGCFADGNTDIVPGKLAPGKTSKKFENAAKTT